MNPTVIISHRKGQAPPYCEALLNKDAVELINAKEIVFINKYGEMKIQLPQYDTNKTHKIFHQVQTYKSKKYTSPSARFYITLDNPEDIIGKYSLEKEEDDIFLVRCEN
jgi:hypothetical protein